MRQDMSLSPAEKKMLDILRAHVERHGSFPRIKVLLRPMNVNNYSYAHRLVQNLIKKGAIKITYEFAPHE